MNNLAGSGVTNSLLTIIAVLLLVMVIQNSSKPSYMPPQMGMTSGMGGVPHNHPPMNEPAGGFHGSAPDAQEEFSPTAMIYAALKCPGNQSITLSETTCQGPEASARRQAVDDAYNKGLPIPKIFDSIIEKYGEAALTEQALDIRRARRG